jgi:hypothetical protein
MIVSEPKPIEEILELLSEVGTVFIVACGGCPIGCDSGGEERIQELSDALLQNGKESTGNVEIEFLCNKALVGTQLEYHLAELKRAQAVLVVSCGVGVQATGKMIDLPVIPASDTRSNQGMQGLWPSDEMCAGCGQCVLGLTVGICPIAHCSKQLLNGPCGGSQDGVCEIASDVPCAWQLIWERAIELGMEERLLEFLPVKDWSGSRDGGPGGLVREGLRLT